LKTAHSICIAILSVVVAVLSCWYLVWSNTPWHDLFVSDWPLGLLAGAIAAALTVPLVRRIPRQPHANGSDLVTSLAWEGVVYGIAEGVLLAMLPVLTLWTATSAAGWTEATNGRFGSGALAIAGALFVILVHHLGYPEFRERAARPKLVGALATCGLQAVAFLLTSSIWAPIAARILLHGEMIFRGVTLPPQRSTERSVRNAVVRTHHVPAGRG
jgi:hypothetical protein